MFYVSKTKECRGKKWCLSFSPISEFQTPISSSRFPGSSDGKASAFNVGDPGLIHELGQSPGEGNRVKKLT